MYIGVTKSLVKGGGRQVKFQTGDAYIFTFVWLASKKIQCKLKKFLIDN